jgi:hypothetical protein
MNRALFKMLMRCTSSRGVPPFVPPLLDSLLAIVCTQLYSDSTSSVWHALDATLDLKRHCVQTSRSVRARVQEWFRTIGVKIPWLALKC